GRELSATAHRPVRVAGAHARRAGRRRTGDPRQPRFSGCSVGRQAVLAPGSITGSLVCRPWTMDDGRWTMDDGPWTMDHGPWITDYRPLPGSRDASHRIWPR